MAQKGILHRFRIELSDVDRGVYETLDLRISRHPSESTRYLVLRTLAFCLLHAPGIVFSKGGVSEGDAPPLSVPDGEGGLAVWVEIGVPGRDRLRKATQKAEAVRIVVAGDAQAALRTVAGYGLGKDARIGILALEASFVDTLAEALERANAWTVVRSDDVVHLTCGDLSLTSALTHRP
jgi:uncharacterized protein YaeQ